METYGYYFEPSLIKKTGFSFQCVTSLKDVDGGKKRNFETKKETLNSQKRGKIKLTRSD